MKRILLPFFAVLVLGLAFGAYNSHAQTAATDCVVSTDDTYGYSKENPIKVGGGVMDGPPRQHAYLRNLLGPKGEKISYTRTRPLVFGGKILDMWEIKGLKETIILYIDEYSYTEPKAPVGFTCVSAFPRTRTQ